MGQYESLPLPERIPYPDSSIRQKMTEEGINLILSSANDDQSPAKNNQSTFMNNATPKYVKYTLPQGWKMVDHSHRNDLPNWKCVDDQNMIRFAVSGSWKGDYDNKLHIHWFDISKLHVPPEGSVEYSPDAATRAVVALSGDNRSFTQSVSRHSDYVPNDRT